MLSCAVTLIARDSPGQVCTVDEMIVPGEGSTLGEIFPAEVTVCQMPKIAAQDRKVGKILTKNALIRCAAAALSAVCFTFSSSGLSVLKILP